MLQLELDLTEEQTELENILRLAAKSSEDLFRIDFISEGTTVIRHQARPRVWIKVAGGDWTREDVQVLVNHGLIVRAGQSAMGWEIRPRPELVGAI